jgi:NAD(P)-dependent dehydrogenase (short-subunit alcohol dehydrogenase family)
MKRLEGRCAIVTGGAGNIGQAITRYLLNEGADVVICGRREPSEAIVAGGKQALFVEADIRQAAQSQQVIDAALAAFGRIDILVNNAGGSPPVESASASPSLTEKLIQLNLIAPLVMSQQAYAALSEGDVPGSIINISSVSAVRSSPGTSAYGAAKAGLLNATQSLAMEWGPKIRVNGLVVGLVYHPASEAHYGGAEGFKRVADMLPMGRMAEPEDIAKAVIYLCSDEAFYVSGASLEVHGGGEVPVFLHLAKQAEQ